MKNTLGGILAAASILLVMNSHARAQSPGLQVFIGTYTRGWACPPENKDSAAPLSLIHI